MSDHNEYLFLFLLIFLACSSQKEQKLKRVTIKPLEQKIEASFRGIASSGPNDLWLGGTNGTVLKTSDSGASFQKMQIPDADSLDFRDIEILSPETILLMSIGNGKDSKIYKTTDAGQTWNIPFQNELEKAFFDGIDFWDERSGMMISDPVDGKLLLLKTEDAGEHWTRVGQERIAPLLATEYGFAASGSGILTLDKNKCWIATGGDAARIFYSPDRGETWEVFSTPINAGNASSGIFSISFSDPLHGVAVGGDYQNPMVDNGNIAYTENGGKNWTLVKNDPPIFHKACVQYLGEEAYLATGRTGTALSRDHGKTWEIVGPDSYYCIAYDLESGVGYLAGAQGKVARFVWE